MVSREPAELEQSAATLFPLHVAEATLHTRPDFLVHAIVPHWQGSTLGDFPLV